MSDDNDKVVPLKPPPILPLNGTNHAHEVSDGEFLRTLAGKLKPDIHGVFQSDIDGLLNLAEVLDTPSVLLLPLERPQPDETWDYQQLRDRYLELADAYEDLFEVPPELDDGEETPNGEPPKAA